MSFEKSNSGPFFFRALRQVRGIMEKFKIDYIDPRTIKFKEGNRNMHPPEQIERLEQLISHYGFRVPMIVNPKTREVTSGNARLTVALRLKLPQVPVIFQEFTDSTDEWAFHISDNAISSWAALDFSGINFDLGEFGPFDVDMLGIKGFEVESADKKPSPEKKEPKKGKCDACGRKF